MYHLVLDVMHLEIQLPVVEKHLVHIIQHSQLMHGIMHLIVVEHNLSVLAQQYLVQIVLHVVMVIIE